MVEVVLTAIVAALTTLFVSGLQGLVSRHIQSRDKAAERREGDLKALVKVVFETRDLAADYWSVGGGSPEQKAKAAKIVGRLTYIARSQSDLFANDPNNGGLSVGIHLDRFHDACTGGEFGQAQLRPMPERCTDIEIYAYALVHRLEASLRMAR